MAADAVWYVDSWFVDPDVAFLDNTPLTHDLWTMAVMGRIAGYLTALVTTRLPGSMGCWPGESPLVSLAAGGWAEFPNTTEWHSCLLNVSAVQFSLE